MIIFKYVLALLVGVGLLSVSNSYAQTQNPVVNEGVPSDHGVSTNPMTTDATASPPVMKEEERVVRDAITGEKIKVTAPEKSEEKEKSLRDSVREKLKK